MIHEFKAPGARKEEPESSGWFAAYTATHHEKRVLEQLTFRNIEAHLPLYKASRKWKKSSVVVLDLPLFPNYVFVRIPQSKRSIVLGTSGVYSIVGSAKSSWELPEPEMEALRSGLHGRNVQPHSYLCVGERASIKSGLLAGLEGIILRQKHNLRFVLSLDQIMQSVVIEVSPEELVAVAGKSTSAPLAKARCQLALV